jgi:hypothetical protein
MPATVSQIASGIATRLGTISGLRTFSFQPDQINPPVAFPILDGITYHGAYGGGDVVTEWTIMLAAGRWSERTSYSMLDDFLSYSGAKSIRAAIEGDKTLGGIVQTLILASASDVSSLSQGEAEFLSVEFSLTVHG